MNQVREKWCSDEEVDTAERDCVMVTPNRHTELACITTSSLRVVTRISQGVTKQVTSYLTRRGCTYPDISMSRYQNCYPEDSLIYI